MNPNESNIWLSLMEMERDFLNIKCSRALTEDEMLLYNKVSVTLRLYLEFQDILLSKTIEQLSLEDTSGVQIQIIRNPKDGDRDDEDGESPKPSPI